MNLQLCQLLEDYLARALSPEDADYFHLRLCPAARLSLQNFLEAQDPAGRARGLLNDRTVFLSNPLKLSTKRRGVELLCIGIQLEGASGREAEWRALVATVRRHFQGKLTYAGDSRIQQPAGMGAWVIAGSAASGATAAMMTAAVTR